MSSETESVSGQAVAPPISNQTTPTPPLGYEPAGGTMQQFPHMPPGMPPFFANPFMSPFMPQGTPDLNMQQGNAPAANPGNPMGFYFSPAQYQEMMQQYFQQMMAASAFQNNTNMPFPMPGMQMNMGAMTRPESQISQTESTAGSLRGGEDKLSTSLSHIQVTESTSSSPEKSTSISVSETGSTVCDVPPDTHEESTATTTKHDSSEDTSNELFGEIQATTVNGDSSPPESVKSEGGNENSPNDSARKTSLPEGSTEKENRTASLIKKQMSEIEKEITRRSQNKNIKQMDDRELAELIGAVSLPTANPQMEQSEPSSDPPTFAPHTQVEEISCRRDNACSIVHSSLQEPVLCSSDGEPRESLYRECPDRVDAENTEEKWNPVSEPPPYQPSVDDSDSDDNERAALLDSADDDQDDESDGTLDIPEKKDSLVVAALPYTSPELTQPAAAPKQTLNQLRSSFNLPENGPVLPPPSQTPQQQVGQVYPQPAHQAAPSHFGSVSVPGDVAAGAIPSMSTASTIPLQQAQPMMAQQFAQVAQQGFPYQMGAPFAFQNPFPQPNYPTQNGQAHFTSEQLAAAALAQAAAAQHLGMFPHIDSAPNGLLSNSTPAVPPPSNGTNGLVPPPPQASNPVQKRTSAPSTTDDWPSDAAQNIDDPVWVMRDSYLKRQQRDVAAHQASTSDWPDDKETPSSSSNGDKDNGNEEEDETDRLLLGGEAIRNGDIPKKSGQKTSKETMVHEPAVLIEGVLFRARYLGSTQMMCESRGSKAARMAQAQEAVARVKAPEGEVQPSTDIDLFISTEKIMVLNTDLQRISDTDVRQDILMDHALRTISYIADIGDLVVLMARRMSASSSDEGVNSVEGVRKSPKIICHVFESEEASFIAQSIGQAFQVAYVEFLRANGIDDPSYLRQIDYQEVLNSQELLGDELEMFARKETQKDVVVPKKAGEALGVVVVESGWGSMLPTVVLAHMAPTGPAARSNQLNIGDQIIAVNGISLVGLPLSAAQKNIQNVKTATAVRLTIVSTPPVVEVRIRRPDTKYQLGFSVQNGVICSLLRGGIAERGGIRVGHRIIEINHHSVVAVAHDRIVNMLATAVGEIHMKTMPTSMFRLLTGQETPSYI